MRHILRRSETRWWEYLILLDACDPEAIDFACQWDRATAWEECERPDWLWWIVDQLGGTPCLEAFEAVHPAIAELCPMDWESGARGAEWSGREERWVSSVEACELIRTCHPVPTLDDLHQAAARGFGSAEYPWVPA